MPAGVSRLQACETFYGTASYLGYAGVEFQRLTLGSVRKVYVRRRNSKSAAAG